MEVEAYGVVHIETVVPEPEINGVAIVAEIHLIERLVVVGKKETSNHRQCRLPAHRHRKPAGIEAVSRHAACSGIEAYQRRAHIVGIAGIVGHASAEADAGAGMQRKPLRCSLVVGKSLFVIEIGLN